MLPDRDETGVHAAGPVLDRALEEQVARGVGSVVVLDDAEVVHLVAAGEVERDLLGRGPGTGRPGLGAHPGVVTPEGHGREADRGVSITRDELVAHLPGLHIEIVRGQVIDATGR